MKTLSVLISLALAGIAAGQTPAKCSDLTKLRLPGVNLVITKTETIPASASAPAHCQADGMIDQRSGAGGKTFGIGFAIALPDNWNNRFLFQGGGGYNGSVRQPLGAAAAGDKPGLARGFAIVSTDTGHKGDNRDTTFNEDQQASLDFAQVAVGRVTEIAKQIVAQYYGQPAKYSYFAGCSTGGREAMLMTQRYPTYFDGVISGDPAMRTGYSNIGNTWVAVAFNQIAPKDDSGRAQTSKVFSDADKKLISRGILQACDANDGIKDGMVFNTLGCKFDPSVLTCTGAKTEACLTSQQVGALKKAFSGPKNSKGDLIYPLNTYDTDIGARIDGMVERGNGVRRQASTPPPLDIDVDQRLFALLDNPLEALTDSTWTNLSSFSAHGGKLLFYHGASDPAFSALDTLDYYQKMSKANGGMDQVQGWSRFYFVPGMAHCRGGEAALDDFDFLTAIVNWVEKGVAPDSVVATGKAFPGRSRPLCAYPKYAQYKGQGDPEDAKNFVCRE